MNDKIKEIAMTQNELDAINERLSEIEEAIEALPELRKKVEELSITVSCIIGTKKAKSKNTERNDRIRALGNQYIDECFSGRLNELKDMNPDERFGMFNCWAELRGHAVERCKGTKTVFTNLVNRRNDDSDSVVGTLLDVPHDGQLFE